METVEKNLGYLIASIKDSREYQEYHVAKAEVEKDPEKKRNLDKYRTRIYEIQNSYDRADLYHSIDRIEQESEKFRKDPVVDKFLSTELALCRMVQKINWTLISELDFDMEFISED